ncbi:MAG: hypothetical protein JXA25_19200 [Anaerolineales bacterium]|nr:hypothetical protein [Anaerolineales bacterium]
MIVSTDSEQVNPGVFKKWVVFNPEETCVAWFSKGFISYKKGYLFTSERLLEFEKKNTIRDIKLAEITGAVFHTKEVIEGLGLKTVEGELTLSIAGSEDVTIRVDEQFDPVRKALTAVSQLITEPVSFSGEDVFNIKADGTMGSLLQMRQRESTVFVKVNKDTFESIEEKSETQQGLIMDKEYISLTYTQPVFHFPAVCAWSGKPADVKTAPFVLEAGEYHLQDINPILNMGKTISNFIKTAGKRVDSLVSFTFELDLPIAEGIEPDGVAQIRFDFSGRDGELAFHFPDEAQAAAFLRLNE